MTSIITYTIYVTAQDGSEARITGDIKAVEAVEAVLDAAGIHWNEQVETYDFGYYKQPIEKADE